jgi:hypothetical protein
MGHRGIMSYVCSRTLRLQTTGGMPRATSCRRISSQKLKKKLGSLPLVGPLYQKLLRVPPALSQCYEEAKLVFKAQKKPSSERSRREIELMRRFQREGLYIGAAAVIFWIPVIGAPTILIGFLYPRQLLTAHFWSEKERAAILKQMYAERVSFKRFLLSRVNQTGLDYSTFAPPFGIYCFDMLPDDHLQALGASLGVSPFLAKIWPPALLRLYLKSCLQSRSVEIAQDDRLLRHETRYMKPEMLSLSKHELEDAVLRRGGDPSLPESSLRRYLIAWLEYSGDFGIENDDDEDVYNDEAREAASHITHACALPELFLVS